MADATEDVMKELKRISSACGNVRVTAKRQAKRRIMEERGLTGRGYVKLRKRTKRYLKGVLLLQQLARANEVITPDPTTILGKPVE